MKSVSAGVYLGFSKVHPRESDQEIPNPASEMIKRGPVGRGADLGLLR